MKVTRSTPPFAVSSAVTNFNNGLEASSDSDDEDKLHIVEEESLQESEGANADGATPQDGHDGAATVLPHNGSWNGGEPSPWKHGVNHIAAVST